MRRALAAAFLVNLAAGGLVLAQEATKAPAPEALPSVDQILDKYVAATGGKEAHEKLTSRQIKGTFDLPDMGSSGTLEVLAKAPNKSALIIDMPGFGVIQQGVDGAVAWEQNPMVGMRDITGTELAARRRDADFHQDIRLKELFPQMTVKERTKLGEREVYVIEATPAEGKAEKFYFDTESGLLLRQDAEREGPEGMVMVESNFEDYREVDGVKLPFTLRRSVGSFVVLVKFTEVKHNVEIDDAKFAKPVAK